MQDSEIRRRFDRIDTKLDQLPEQIHQRYVPREVYDAQREYTSEQLKRLENHEGRIHRVERAVWVAAGAAAAVGSAVGGTIARALGG